MVQQHKQTKKQDSAQQAEERQPQKVDTKPGLDEDIDNLLADIDEVLEENAEEFVRAYIQKGGQ